MDRRRAEHERIALEGVEVHADMLPDARAGNYFSGYRWALQPHSASGTLFAPPVRPVASFVCPQFCVRAGSPLTGFSSRILSESSVYHWRSSCPEYAQGELPCTVFSWPLPVISPASAPLVPRAIVAATAIAAKSLRFIRSSLNWRISLVSAPVFRASRPACSRTLGHQQ